MSEHQQQQQHNNDDDEVVRENSKSTVLSLHSSFDGTPFRHHHAQQKDSIFRLGDNSNGGRDGSMWDTYVHGPNNSKGGEASENADAELTGKKHLRQQAHQTSISLPPGTVRKLPRRTGGGTTGLASTDNNEQHQPTPTTTSSVGSRTPGRHYLTSSSSSSAASSSQQHNFAYHGLPPPTPVSNLAPLRRRALSTPGRGSSSSSSSSSLSRNSPYRVSKSPFRKGHVAVATTPRSLLTGSKTTTATSTPTRTALSTTTPIMKGGNTNIGGGPSTLIKTRTSSSCAQTTANTTANTTTTMSSALMLDATLDSEDAATLSPATPFRFTSFPASLPRVQPKTTTSSEAPTTVRKRMTFSSKVKASAAEGDADTSMAKKPLLAFLSAASSYSRDNEEERTQNSSISSVSGEAGQQQQQTQQQQLLQQGGGGLLHQDNNNNAANTSLTQAPSFPPPVLEWKSPDLAQCSAYNNSRGGAVGPMIDPKYSEDSNDLLHESSHRRPVAIHTKLFSDETIEEIGRGGYGGGGGTSRLGMGTTATTSTNNATNEKCETSPVATVPRTRLNFNMLMKPVDEKEAEREKQHADNASPNNKDHTGSGGASAYSSENMSSSNSDGMDCGSCVSTSAMTPSRPSAVSGGMMLMMMNGSSSNSSLIQHAPPTPDEVQFHFHVDGAPCSPIPGIPEEEGENEMELDRHHATATSPPLNGNKSGGGDASFVAIKRSSSSGGDAPKALDLSHQSSDSSTSSSKLRKLRPMPDMSAFDAGSIKSGASSSRNGGGGGGGGADKSASDGGDANQPRLLCPPTPVRTPAWAHNENPFLRANSLIATKVLATCPISVVDGHSSLENSLMDDDTGTAANAASAAAVSVAAAEALQRRRSSLSFSTLPEEGAAQRNEENDMSEDILAVDSADSHGGGEGDGVGSLPKTPFAGGNNSNGNRWPPPKLLTNKSGEIGSVISFTNNFENLGQLGSGAFADVFKVRSRTDGQLYAVKRNRRQFRGKRDRDLAMTEVRTMQKLQNVVANNTAENNGKVIGSKTLYLLFFYRAWQEEGYFFCQTELCCRDTCRELMESLKLYWEDASRKYPSLLKHLAPTEESFSSSSSENDETGRLLPEQTWWKICHDICAGLSHIHSQGIVHHDIKPSNIFFVSHARFGAMCKIGDFGMAGETGTAEDGQEGDTFYMAPELLSSSIKHPSADLFSLGLTLYELAASVSWELPVEGPRWHEVRSGSHLPEIDNSRSPELGRMVQRLLRAEPERRPTADWLLEQSQVKEAGLRHDAFLHDYIHDVEEFDRIREERIAQQQTADVGFTPRNDTAIRELRTPTPSIGIPHAPVLFTPDAVNK